MKYIEISKTIDTSKKLELAEAKKILLERLENVIDVESVTEKTETFKVTGSTSSPGSLSRYCHVKLNVTFMPEKGRLKVIISGHIDVTKTLLITYMLFVIAILLWGFCRAPSNRAKIAVRWMPSCSC